MRYHRRKREVRHPEESGDRPETPEGHRIALDVQARLPVRGGDGLLYRVLAGDPHERSSFEQSGILPTVLGLLALLFGATTVFAQIQAALNNLWDVRAQPSRSEILGFIRTRLLSLSLILVIGFLMLVSFALSVAIGVVVSFASGVAGHVAGGLQGGILRAETSASRRRSRPVRPTSSTRTSSRTRPGRPSGSWSKGSGRRERGSSRRRPPRDHPEEPQERERREDGVKRKSPRQVTRTGGSRRRRATPGRPRSERSPPGYGAPAFPRSAYGRSPPSGD